MAEAEDPFAVISLRVQKALQQGGCQHKIYIYIIRTQQPATNPCTWSPQVSSVDAHLSTCVLDMSLDIFECMDTKASLKSVCFKMRTSSLL